MNEVDDYLASLSAGTERAELIRLDRMIRARVPATGQGVSHSMPCYTYREVPFAAIVIRRRHIGWYPYSGSVLPELGDELAGYSRSVGTLRFTPAKPLPDALAARLIDVGIRQIEDRLAGEI